MIRILMIEDEAEIIRFVRLYFSKIEGYEFLAASNGKEGLELLSQQPHIILLDIMMPEMNGLEFCRLARDHLACPILFLTAKTGEEDILSGFAAGGDDYILKPFRVRELHARIDAHLRRDGRRNKTSRMTVDDLWIDFAAREAGSRNTVIHLTKKEFDILELLFTNGGQAFTREQIYEKIWGYDAEGDAETSVTEHIKRLRSKLQNAVQDRIQTVWGIGYRWRR